MVDVVLQVQQQHGYSQQHQHTFCCAWVEFFEKPEVQEKIEEVKEKTLDIAEKGVSKLREWLKPDEKDEEE